MQVQIIVGFVLLACACAQVSQPPSYKERYPDHYMFAKSARHPRDVTWIKRTGDGRIFGTLSALEEMLIGKAGYRQDIFNDGRGVLTGEAYGSRVLSPYGDNSYVGGKLDWTNANKNADATFALTKEIGGSTNAAATASKVWNLDKNTHVSAGGTVSQDLGHGKPDVGVAAKFEHVW
ncbi:gloverin-like [Vanessa tameamea]|uniref:Gloverin-like n=1 Tax=Vanessa tameamea TaxID=334116 RepID=A0A8B8IKV1_VANTA|nr:gloverin-like [Vanessa tameamea]XP_026497730.1 gloverin-like [Vanessa tameamea]